jgi:arogenate/prephenate dehydratase
VAYQGVPGAYSEVAAAAAAPGADPLPCAQFEVAFQALSQWLADTAVLPIENSAGGSVHAVYDLLLRYAGLHLTGEVALAVSHCLLAPAGTALADVHTVASHPQALAQCAGYLRRLGAANGGGGGGAITREAADDTAGAARDLARHPRPGVAAIASARAAELYGLDILASGVQDSADNVTRFLVLGRDPAVSSPGDARPYRTSLVCALPDGPGALFKALSAFALRDIDLSKVESRPLTPDAAVAAGMAASVGGGVSAGGDSPADVASSPFRYLFYFDVLANLASPAAQNALRHLQEVAPYMRVLGSYPIDAGEG